MANFEKQYSLRKIKQPTDKYLDDVKEVLVDKGVVLEDTPYDLMPDAITEGFVEIEEKEQALEDVKHLLVNKGIVNEDTSYSELDDVTEESLVNLKPENIKNGIRIGTVKGTLGADLSSINLDECIVQKNYGFDNAFYASNGIDVYGSYSSSEKLGIYHVNSSTNELTQIYAEGYNWKYWVEDNSGNIFVSSSVSNYKGIICLKSGVARKVYQDGYYWGGYFLDDDGIIYLQSYATYSTSFGLLAIENGVCEKIITGYTKGSFYKTKTNELYWISSGWGDSDGKGLVYIHKGMATSVTNKGQSSKIIEHNGYIYYGSYQIGLGILKKDVLTNILDISMLNWTSVCLSNGKIYIFMDANCYYVYENTVSTITLPKSMSYKFKDSKENIYLQSGDAKSYYMFANEEFKLLYTDETYGMSYTKFFEASNGNIYANSTYSQMPGMLCIKNGECTVLSIPSGYRYNYVNFFEDSKGNIYVQNNNYTTNIIHIDDTTVTLLPSVTKDFTFFAEIEEGVLVSNTNVPDTSSTIYLFVGADWYTVKIKED